MDRDGTPLETVNREPFHDFKGRKENRKEMTGYRSYTETRPRAEYKQSWAKSRASWDQNSRRGSYARKLVPGVSHEFRVVRDNRSHQKANMDVIQESIQNSAEDNDQIESSVYEKSSSREIIEQNHPVAKNSDGHMGSQDLNRQGASVPSQSIDTKSSSIDKPSPADEVINNSGAHYTSSASANSPVGVYSSFSDPVHVPSAGTTGAMRREVGVVGVRRGSFDRTTVHASISSNSLSTPPVEKGDSSSVATFGQCATTYKSNNSNPFPASEHSAPSMSVSKSFTATQYNLKSQQQVGHQKAKHPNVEWKPKLSARPNPNSHNVPAVITSVASSSVASSTHSSQMQMADLSEKILQVNISNDEQVIIPHHLQVPESERTRLTFGSFGAGFDSTKGFGSACQALGISKEPDLETSSSIPTSVPVGSNEDSAAGQSGLVKSLARNSTSDSPASAAELDHPLTVNCESFSPRDIESYPDIGLVQGHNPSYSSPKSHQAQNHTNLPSFSAYEPQMRFGIPFSGTIVDHNALGQSLCSAPEAFSSHVAGSGPVSSIPIIQQQSQQQPLTQFYPQVQISHYPNYPYRQIYSPVYVPQMGMANYSNNPSYSHPSNGNNYLLMSSGNSHVTTSGVKFTASQYKPIHSGSPTNGFGNFTNPGGYTVGTPRTIGTTTGFEDVGRIKDNNPYVQNPQAEASDIWIQTPTELAGLQSTPYYNLPGQAAPAAHPAFLPAAHGSHQSFNAAAVAAQSPHVQYTSFYHPSQQVPISGPMHHLIHQQALQGLGANVGVGGPVAAAAAAAQVGAYQQTQIGHFGWTNNF
ncbi:uncharacterized protein M6B38_259340 [Iris pallida]|uniref:GBF-interacting protein 1 N-terminal domain-containing protein n=1 Tax=Iris pallida TaxID=29817 RepID=A0AAX6IEZ3_IRIPA|nr:uncharacterized protein M6B38_259340 [Iris pallida]